MDPNNQNNPPTATQSGGQVPPQNPQSDGQVPPQADVQTPAQTQQTVPQVQTQTPQQGVVQPAQSKPVQPQTVQQAPQNPAPAQSESRVNVPQQESTQTVAQQQSSSNMFAQTSDSAPPVPSQSVPQPTAPVDMPPPPKKKGGLFRNLFFILFALTVISIPILTGVGYAVATDIVSINENVDSNIKQLYRNFGIGDATPASDQPENALEAEDDVQDESQDFVASESADVIFDNPPIELPVESDVTNDSQLIVDAVLEFYELYSFLPDTDDDTTADDFPRVWTCIGRAPQCYDLEKAGMETSTTLVPDFLPGNLTTETGHSQESGYEIIYEEETARIIVRPVNNPDDFSSGNIES